MTTHKERDAAQRLAVGAMLTTPVHPSKVHRVFGDRSHYPMTPEIQARVARYSSSAYLPEAVARAKELTIASHPASPEDGAKVCGRLAKFLDWCLNDGRDIYGSPTDVLSEARLVQFNSEVGGKKKSRYANNSAIRRVRRATTAERRVVFAKNADVEEALAPYSDDEVKEILSRAYNAKNGLARHSYQVWVAFGLGAGLRPREIDVVRGTDVFTCEAGTFVQVADAEFPRVIRIVGPYDALARDLAVAVGENSICDPVGSGRGAEACTSAIERMQTSDRKRLAARKSGRTDYTLLSARRARVTWLVNRMEAQDQRVDEFVLQAGLESLGALTRYFQYLPPLSAQVSNDTDGGAR